MPVYNEVATIGEILDRVLTVGRDFTLELLVVDDASTDGTRELLKQRGQSCPEMKLFFHDRNLGKGAAIRTALPDVTGDVVIIQDADLEYDPGEYPRLLDPIVQGRAAVVFGNRFHGGAHRVLYYWHSLGNHFLTTLADLLTNLNLSDMEVGYKVFRTDVFRKLRIRSNRFGFEPEVTVKIAKLKCPVYEVPISYHGRTYEQGKKITWRDGLIAIYCLIRYRFFD
jgi:glycosyltransferase involved in cell wall biosynthesis